LANAVNPEPAFVIGSLAQGIEAIRKTEHGSEGKYADI
jgi:hypothetical protein